MKSISVCGSLGKHLATIFFVIELNIYQTFSGGGSEVHVMLVDRQKRHATVVFQPRTSVATTSRIRRERFQSCFAVYDIMNNTTKRRGRILRATTHHCKYRVCDRIRTNHGELLPLLLPSVIVIIVIQAPSSSEHCRTAAMVTNIRQIPTSRSRWQGWHV